MSGDSLSVGFKSQIGFANNSEREVVLIDGQQLRRVYEEHGAALVLYARQWCVHPDDALQDALIDLAHQTAEPRDPVAWLFKTVRCKAMNQSRSEHRRSKYQQLAAEQREPWFTSESDSMVDASEMQFLLSELPALDREIVVARIWGDMSFEQIAELVERSMSFVYRRYQCTLIVLEKKMNGHVREPS